MGAPIGLEPAWKSIPMSGICSDRNSSLFATIVDDGLGLVIAGGPLRVCVFQIFSRQRLWLTLIPRQGFSGYALLGGVLYLQDGPVLTAWSMTEAVASAGGESEPLCLSAINLVTRASASVTAGGGLTVAQLDQVYQMPADSATLLQAVRDARQRLAWTDLLAQIEAARAIWTGSVGPLEVWRAASDYLLEFVRDMCVAADPEQPKDTESLQRNARAAAERAEAATTLFFSAPVVRSRQISAAVKGLIFVLSADGTVYGVDDALSHVEVAKFEAPGPLRLALAEIQPPNDPNTYLCRLYYITSDGGIRQVNATASPIAAGGLWPANGAVSNLLPLRFEDGHLFGGGVLGLDFFVLPPDPPAPATVSVAAGARPWLSYAVDPATRLALVCDGQGARLTAYGDGVHVRDRWQVAPAAGWGTFWPAGGGTGPTLVLSTDAAAASETGNAGFRIFVANTVDAADLSHASTYPPPTPVLATGSFEPGTLSPALTRVGEVATAPVIARQTAYLFTDSGSPFLQVVDLVTPVGDDFNSPFDLYVAQMKTVHQDSEGVNAATLAPPMLGTTLQLVAYDLSAVASQVAAPAAAELVHLQKFTQGIVVQALMVFSGPGMDPTPIKQVASFFLSMDNGDQCPVKTDTQGCVTIDSKYDGRQATLVGALLFYDPMGDSYQLNWTGYTSDTVTLSVDQTARMTITITFPAPS